MMVRLPTSRHRGPNLALGFNLQARSASARLRGIRRETARRKDIDALLLVRFKDLDIARKREVKASLWVDRVCSTHIPNSADPNSAVNLAFTDRAVERRSRCSQDRSYTRQFA